MADTKKNIDELNSDLVQQRLKLNKSLASKLPTARAPLTSVLTDTGERKEQFDYIEKFTGNQSYLSTPDDTISKNFIQAQYNEAKKNSQDQGTLSEFGGFLAQSVVGEIIMGAGAGAGYLLDVQHWGDQLMGGEGDWGNWFSDYMEEGKSWLREAAPIHQDPDNLGRTMWQNMLHGDGWWAENGVSVASSLSILLPVAGWAKGVSLAGKGLNYASQGARVGKWGAKVAKGTRTVDKVMDIVPMIPEKGRRLIDGIHKATVSRLIESQMEATEVFKSKYEEYLETPGMSEEEAKSAAGAAAAFTYKYNWGAMLTDLPQYMLLGTAGRKLKGALNTKRVGLIKDSKLLSKTKAFRNTGITMFSEGMEEAYQYIVAEEGRRMGDIQAGLVDPEETTLGERLSGYMHEADLQTSALFGALGGGVFSAAGPKATQLINKSFRKGETRMTNADLRVREASDRFARLAHNMDMINQTSKTGDEEAIFSAKSNMAFEMAKEAVLVNNWEQARESMAQLKNATPEEKEAYEIKENFGEFVENIDEWIAHMDVAADIVERAKSKHTYGLAEQIAKRQFDKYMYDTQAPKLRTKLAEEKKNVISNINELSKDGDTAVEMQLDILGMEKTIVTLEKLIQNGKMPAKDLVILRQQAENGREYINQRKANFKEIVDASALTEEDKLALEAVEGGTADDLIRLSAKQKLLDFQNKQNVQSLNFLTSREGRREYKKKRALDHALAKAQAQAKKDQDAVTNAMDEAATGEPTSISKNSNKDLSIAEVAKAVQNGADINTFAEGAELTSLKAAVADFNSRNEQDPSIALEEEEDDLELTSEDLITFNEDIEDEVNVLDEETIADDEFISSPTEDLNAELEAAEAHDEIEIPTNDEEGSGWRITNKLQETTLSSVPGQLAWLSANNPEVEEVTDEMKALSAYLETPSSAITDLEVKFDFNRDWIRANPSERYTRMMRALSEGKMPLDSDIGFMPIQATIMENGAPVVYQGFEMKMNMHDPSFYFKKDGVTPKYKDVSEHQAQLAILHKKAIISQMLKGGEVIAKINGKSRGKLNAVPNEDGTGTWAKNYVAQTLKTPVSSLKFLVGNKQGNYITADKRPRLALKSTATPGAIYTEVSTANGSKFPLRLNIDNISVEEATVIHALYLDLLNNPSLISSTISDGILKYITESKQPRLSGISSYLPNLAEMTYQELLNHLVYEGTRTMAHKEFTLTYFVNTEKGGVKLPNAVQFGKTKLPADRLENEKGKAEFIQWLTENKRRQVDSSMLNSEEYKTYLNDSKILSTNVATTPQGNVFVQPVISYSTNMRVENVEQVEKETETELSTDELAIEGLKKDLAFEQASEFGNKERADEIQSQIDALETPNKIDDRLEDKKADIEVRRQEELKPYDERDARSLEAITPNNPNHPTIKVGMKQSDGQRVLVEKSNADNWNGEGEGYKVITAVKEPAEFDNEGKMIKAAKIEEGIFNSKEEADAAIQAKFERLKSKAGQKQKEINAKYDAEIAALGGQVEQTVVSSIAETINMFQTGIKTENGGTINVNTVESIALEKEAATPTKTAEEVIQEEVTPEETTQIAQEENIEESEVVAAIKEEVASQINSKEEVSDKASLLKRVANRLKKTFIRLMLVTSIFNTMAFSFNTTTDTKAYDTVSVSDLTAFDNVYKDQEAINKEGNLKVITESFSGSNESYLVVDKQGAVAHLFQGDSLVTTYEVGTGKEKGDEQTKTVVKNGKVLWQEGNKQTGAGIYTVGGQGTYKHSPSYTLNNERGISVPTVLHETLSDRKKLFNNNTVEDNRMSYGCVNFQAASLQDLGKRNVIKPGSKVFILPDNPLNKFQMEDGKVQFKSADENVNRSLVNYEAQEVVFKAKGVNAEGKQFLVSLQESKAKLMQLYPTISNDIYNQISKIAYGVFGQESSFGTFGGVRGKLGYIKDEVGTALGKDMSVGVTQLRFSSLTQSAKEVLDIKSVDDIKDNVDKAAAGTMSLLLDMYVNQIPANMKSQFTELLPLGYSNRTEFKKAINGNKAALNNQYINKVSKYGENVTAYLGQTSEQQMPSAPTSKTVKKSGVEAVISVRSKKAKGQDVSKSAKNYADKLKEVRKEAIIDRNNQDKGLQNDDFKKNPC